MKVGGMFKSPMTIMMIVSMAMMAFLPKMMANLDPEQLEVNHKFTRTEFAQNEVVSAEPDHAETKRKLELSQLGLW